MNIEYQIQELSDEIKQDKSDLSKAEGSIETLLKRLKEEEEIDTLEEAEGIIQEIEKEVTFLQKDIESKIETLKEIYHD